ncbi:MAG: acyltransferase family protein [Actinomycetes bacterium]
MGYQPALDGLRAVAVSAVLLFHLGVSWMPGGYLGVSVFFTLSGFLITTLLIRERVSTGRIDSRAFYTRRLRRLMPASLACIAGVCVVIGVGLIADTASLRREVLGALFQVENWVSLLGGQSYAELFQSPSPVAHFWSLAIEEQFYWLWPPVVTGLLIWSTRGARPLQRMTYALVGLFVLFSLSVPITLRLWSADAVYFASWTRFAEILAGGALAAFVALRNPPSWVRWFAAPSLVAIVWLCIVTPSGRGWAYEGGLPLFALISVLLILSLQTAGPIRTVLATAPLVAIGRVSFGLYLYHWPVFVVLDAERTGLDGWQLGTLRMAVTIAITLVSYFLLEQPIRERRWLLRPQRLVVALGAAFVAVAVLTFATVPVPATAERPAVLGGPTGAKGTTGAPGASADDRPPVVAVFGDSVPAWLIEKAAPSFTRTDVVIANGAHEACDAALDFPVGYDRVGTELREPDDCEEWDIAYGPVLRQTGRRADIALLVLGASVVTDHLVDGERRSPCETLDWYTRDVADRIAFLRDEGAQVVMTIPSWPGERSQFVFPSDYAERMGCVRDALTALAAAETVPTIDLAPQFCPAGPAGDCEKMSLDGLHIDPDKAPAVFDWLLDQVLATQRADRAASS